MRRSRTVVGVILATLGTWGSLGVTAGIAPAAAKIVMPVPASSGQVLKTTLSFPPDTTYCRTKIHISCYQPAQFQKAYNLAPLFEKGINGAGQTIVIIDSFGSPTIEADLKHFDATFGLPDPPTFTIIQPAGAVPPFPTGSPLGPSDVSGWGVETSLDVEYAHTMAPGADILLVETPTSEIEGVTGFPEIVAAENYVIDHHLGSVISQSFGATEETFPSRQSILDLRSAYLNARRHHVTILASSGDQGSTSRLADTTCCFDHQVNSWPSSDPLVTSIGGTQLHLDLQGNRQAPDNVWNDFAVFGPNPGASGGGPSKVFERPDFQDHVEGIVGDQRGTPDISMSAAVDGAAVFYYSFCDYGRNDPVTQQPPLCGPQWHLVGGTSESSPLFAGVIALANQWGGKPVGYINDSLYQLAKEHGADNGIVDVTSGDNTYVFCASACGTPQEVDTTVPGFPARPGYDMSSGWGTVDAARFVPALAEGGDQ
jgi:subtilase family serine protease